MLLGFFFWYCSLRIVNTFGDPWMYDLLNRILFLFSNSMFCICR